MGVDATFFARKARRAIYLDRLYAFFPEGGDMRADAIYHQMRDGVVVEDDQAGLIDRYREPKGANDEGVLYLLQNLRQDPENVERKGWLYDLLEQFVRDHPGDEYFIVSDADWTDDFEVRRHGDYQVWDPFCEYRVPPWSPDYRPPPPAPPPPPMSPEDAAKMRADLDALVKALEAGSTLLNPGQPLVVEPLDLVWTGVDRGVVVNEKQEPVMRITILDLVDLGKKKGPPVS